MYPVTPKPSSSTLQAKMDLMMVVSQDPKSVVASSQIPGSQKETEEGGGGEGGSNSVEPFTPSSTSTPFKRKVKPTRQPSSTPWIFSRLPPELLRLVLIGYASFSKKSAREACLLSSTVKGWILPLLYKSPCLTSDRLLRMFARTLAVNPELGGMVEELLLHCIFWGSGANENDIVTILSSCTSVKLLFLGPLESECLPYLCPPNVVHGERGERYPQDPIPPLKELTLNWDAAIPPDAFLHPSYQHSLERLHVVIRDDSTEAKRLFRETLMRMKGLDHVRIQGEGGTLTVCSSERGIISTNWPREKSLSMVQQSSSAERQDTIPTLDLTQQDNNDDEEEEEEEEEGESDRLLDMLGASNPSSLNLPANAAAANISKQLLTPHQLSVLLPALITSEGPPPDTESRSLFCISLKLALANGQEGREIKVNFVPIQADYTTHARVAEFESRVRNGLGVWAGA
ncbi:hypothetical protein IE53DRAFT_359295 [Violaceomyces palustris]|uniref:Uncharacterized protein n=1 Tax=Violaceomyces palustris TaxID=1673888 RepID=A0ACD0P8F4_9BASI|nr:hypothetical protein IE53DRAFT_359295 [Violaceomyces palustris]